MNPYFKIIKELEYEDRVIKKTLTLTALDSKDIQGCSLQISLQENENKQWIKLCEEQIQSLISVLKAKMEYHFNSVFNDVGTSQLKIIDTHAGHLTFYFYRDVGLYQKIESEITLPKKASKKLRRALKNRLKHKINADEKLTQVFLSV